MDLSKIPNSQPSADRPGTPQPKPAANPAEPYTPDSHQSPPPPHYPPSNAWLEGPDALFVGIIGIIVCWYVSPFFAFVLHKLTGSPFTYTYSDVDGSPLAYTASWFFIGHSAGAAAGLAMIFEGIALGFIRKKSAAWAVVAAMALAAVINVGALVYLFPRSGAPLLQLLCALICAYAAWSLYNRLKA